MNTMVHVANGCEHEWDRYGDLPGGEDPLRYRQCTKCGEIVGVMLGEHRDRFHVRTLHCHVCGKPATGRNWGCRRFAARCKWVCKEHLKPRPIFDVMIDEDKCATCGVLLKPGSRVHVRSGSNRPQCMVCFLNGQRSER